MTQPTTPDPLPSDRQDMGPPTPVPSLMNSNPPPERNMRLWIIASIIGLVGLILLVVVVRSSAPASVATATISLPHPDPVEETTHKAEQQSETAIASILRRNFLDDVEKQDKLLNQLEADQSRWEREARALLTDNRGKRLGASDDSILAFKAINGRKRLAAEDLARHHKNLKSLVVPVQAANATDNTFRPTKDMLELLASTAQAIQLDLDGYREDRETLDAVINRTPQPTDSTVTLQQAVADYDARKALDRGQDAAQRVKVVEEQQSQKLAKLQEDQGKRQIRHEYLTKLAQDPEFLKLFESITKNPKGEYYPFTWQIKRLGRVYYSEPYFNEALDQHLREVYGDNTAPTELLRRKDKAKSKYNATLWSLFRVLVQYRRDLFLSDDDVNKAIAFYTSQPKVNQHDLDSLKQPAAGGPLAEPNTPP